MDPLFPEIPEDFADVDDEALAAFVTAAEAVRDAVTGNAADFVGEGRTKDELLAEFAAGIEALKAAKAEHASRAAAAAAAAEELAATVAELAADDETEEEAEDAADDAAADDAAADEPEVEEAAAETVVAAAAPAKPARLPRPPRSIAAAPVETPELVAMTASAGGLGPDLGQPVDDLEVARMTIKKRSQFGQIPRGTKGEKISIAQFDIRDQYPEDRRLTTDAYSNQAKIDAVLDEASIKRTFEARREEGSLVASGGLCAPVTPYYNLQMVSVPTRPVRAALPAFQADRGGINAAQPLTLADITTAVGVKTAAQDAVGGTTAEKTCQVIACPDFVETDVNMIYHCVQFGNLGARAYPERVAQANSLVLAAHARTAESQLLTNISAASTAVTAASLGLGAAADFLGEILAAAAGMRSRHRMSQDAVLRALLPAWVLDLLVSDTYRTQFGRFDMTPQRFVSLIRSGNVEPSFYIDGAAGAAQVFGAQAAGALLAFPTTTVWYLFPEGSFLYLDAGTLELGIVRDSILNATNDFQIFGESFENVAYIGVESLEITSTICDSGTVTLPVARACPVEYAA